MRHVVPPVSNVELGSWSRKPDLGSSNRGHLQCTKGVLFVSLPPVGPPPAPILYVGLAVPGSGE